MKLKLYSLVGFMTIIGSFVSQTDAIMENRILDLLEEIRNRMCHQLFGLPALDPLEIKHYNVNMDNKYVVDFTCSITDCRLTGLSDFNVTKLKISPIPLTRSNFNIVFPLSVVKSLYTAKGSLGYIVYLLGDDKADIRIDNLKLSMSWILRTDFALSIRKLRIEISIGTLLVDIGSLMEEPRLNEFLHALINEMGIELLNDLWVEAQDKGVIKYIEDTINNFLGNYTLSDVLKFIAFLEGADSPLRRIPADCRIRVL